QTRRDGTPSRLKIRQSFPQERLSGKAIEEVAHGDRRQKTEDRGQDHSEKQKAESRKQKWHYKTARLWDYGLRTTVLLLSLVKVMGADGHGPDGFTLNAEGRPQIARD